MLGIVRLFAAEMQGVFDGQMAAASSEAVYEFAGDLLAAPA